MPVVGSRARFASGGPCGGALESYDAGSMLGHLPENSGTLCNTNVDDPVGVWLGNRERLRTCLAFGFNSRHLQ